MAQRAGRKQQHGAANEGGGEQSHDAGATHIAPIGRQRLRTRRPAHHLHLHRPAGPSNAAKPAADAPTAASATGSGATKPAAKPLIVARVVDGDTIKLRDGRTIRLLQVDAPEATQCYGGRATLQLRHILKPGTRITIAADAKLPKRDSAGRMLRYVNIGRTSVNRLLVQRGAAMPHFISGKRGRLATALLQDARDAKRAQRGLWRSCERVRITPSAGAHTGPA